MSGFPPSLDAGQIGALATLLDRHAERHRAHAQRIDAIRSDVATWWVGDAADAFKGHTTDRAAALNAIGDATWQVAGAARAYAAQIASDLPAYQYADARADQAWDAGAYIDAASWAWERGGIHRRLEAAARAFVESIEDRFADAPWYAELFDDDDDLDSIAAEREDRRADQDRFLSQRSASAINNGYVDGTPDRILPPVRIDGQYVRSEEWSRRVGLSIPYRVLNFSLTGGHGGTMKVYPDGTVEIEVDQVVGLSADAKAGDLKVGAEGTGATVQRYFLPNEEVAAEFRRRLERVYADQNTVALGSINPYRPTFPGAGINEMLTESRQFEDQFGRYRETSLQRTTISPRVRFDSPFVDVDGSYSLGQEVDSRTGQTTYVRRIQGDLRGTASMFTAGTEVDIEVRRAMTDGDLSRVEVTVTGFGRGGVAAETDVLRQLGANEVPQVNRVLDVVSARREETAGVYGRYRISVDATTPEGRRLAEGIADTYDGGSLASAIPQLATGRGDVRMQFETGTYTGSKTDIDAIVVFQDSRRNFEVDSVTDVTRYWGRRP